MASELSSPVDSASGGHEDLHYDIKETHSANVAGRVLNETYVLGKMLGKGSFGTVIAAVDLAHGSRAVAIKEMDARKLKRKLFMAGLHAGGGGGGLAATAPPPGFRGGFSRGGVFGGVGRRPQAHTQPQQPQQQQQEKQVKQADPIDLVRREIAIMKKLHHPHIVRLFEVLHDPSSETIYMVYELLEKGVVMDISLDQVAQPFSETQARFYFRQLILGIEYLHENQISHRDIKPDNLLISKDNVLKIVDFGVSEMFSNEGNDKTKATEGSPAFFSPELCTSNHGELSARAVDVWAIGVTLYCFVLGKLPFGGNGGSIVDLYEDIKKANPDLSSPLLSADLTDLLQKLLDKNPISRITVDGIREHPWTTERATNPLLPSKAQNCHKLVTEPTKDELAAAVCVFNPVWTVMRAVQKFKKSAVGGPSSGVGGAGGSQPTSQESLNTSSTPASVQASTDSVSAAGGGADGGLGAAVANLDVAKCD
ncbi:kinase-like domain-containing protein [Obelidium mucronatum]|nr:kinase-like domain-containing protein [Obelidium mucronatum]